MTTIKYTTKINSTDSDVKTISCDKYEDLCKNVGCYEVIPDDENVKLYFDIDFKQSDDMKDVEYNEEWFNEILNRALDVINKFCIEDFNQPNPRYTICQSNSSTLWKVSIHINVENVIATKKTQKIIGDELNNYAKKFTDVNDYMPGLKLFDTSVYSSKSKMRSLWCSKVGEDRPLVLHSGTFEGHCISAFIPDDAIAIHKEPISVPYITSVVNETNNVMDYKKFDAYIDAGLLIETCNEGSNNDYTKVGYAFINILGVEKARTLFHKLTMNWGSQNKKDEFDKFYDYLCIRKDRNMKVGRKTIIEFAKKVDAKKLKEINKRFVEYDPNDCYVENDDEASDILVEELKHALIFNKGRLFLKHNHVWMNDTEYIDNFLLTYILKKRMYKKNDNGDRVMFVQNIKNTKNVKEAVMAKIKIIQDIDLYEKFHSTTKGRLCYLDGILDFIQKRFYKWEEVDFEYYSCVQIPTKFYDYFANPDRDVMDKVKDIILKPLFEDKLERALHFFGRAMAGHIEDKNFMTYLGNRNCGKGIIYTLLKGFGDYVKPLVLNNLLCSKKDVNTQEASRMLYWLLDFEFVRLGINQETPEAEKGLKINAVLWKKLVSGGDEQTARRNYDRKDTTFKIQMTPAVFGNNSLSFTEQDCKEHEIGFQSLVQFKTKAKIDELRLQGVDERILKGYRVSDETLKDKCEGEEYRKAFMMLLFESYKCCKVEIENDIDEEDKYQSITERLLDNYEFTQDKDDMILVSDILPDLDKKKVMMELQKLGIIKTRCYSGEYRKKWVYVGIKSKEN